jgi:hypothetical protein
MENEDQRLIFQKAIACNSLGAFAHISQSDMVNYASIILSLLTAVTLLPKVADAIKELEKKWKNW